MQTTNSQKPTVEFKDIVRLIDKDVKGQMSIFLALTKVRGISFMLANAICNVLDIDKHIKVGDISSEELKKIEDCARNSERYGIPEWLLNRRKDRDTGKDLHLVSADLRLRNEFDIRFLKKIRCYRGVRHTQGAKKVRGQKTRTTGRKGKTMGVKRKKKSGKKG